ncbi:MAG: YXWGXW repeat-containing protein [Gluconacetobacter diazotrophicus]|nr:YXWGXW repeat-containing protein [Gluconacetobacter diazotrophicus]
MRIRPRSSRRPLLLAALMLALPVAGCVYYPPPPPPRRPPPPAPVVEVIPAAPSAVYVWRPGHWRWDGYRYNWVRGRYVLRPA